MEHSACFTFKTTVTAQVTVTRQDSNQMSFFLYAVIASLPRSSAGRQHAMPFILLIGPSIWTIGEVTRGHVTRFNFLSFLVSIQSNDCERFVCGALWPIVATFLWCFLDFFYTWVGGKFTFWLWWSEVWEKTHPSLLCQVRGWLADYGSLLILLVK